MCWLKETVIHLLARMIKVVDNISQMFYRHNKLKLNFCFAV